MKINNMQKICYTTLLFSSIAYADISGTVFRDFNLDGVKSSMEPGVSGLSVKAYNDSGVVDTQTTDSNGHYTLNTAAGKYRVEVSNLPSYLKPGTAINGSTASLVTVVNDGSTNDVGLINAGEYCQTNPNILVTRMTKGSSSGVNKGISAFLQFQYTDNGEDNATELAQFKDVGSIYGVAHLKRKNLTYLASYFKRHAGIGPAGIGAIYKYDHTTNSISTFTTLPGTDLGFAV